ncbi:conserved hypothetical protein [Paenibacillus curdlanolyticus YK9]|uniref:Uncharacterized protein n=1 Tax=Paenibacillus curdlanolyticus YK9 TaxID=717606 RepID=E0IBT7_9BACL|nr:hypothetical protein [Paenibacillus curdlanolyticus]EFM10167.1 conserved hypothetical protein [Paenibacillus curdlanolyticus YK9]
MKLPFPRWILKTPVQVYQTELSEDGEPVEELIFDGLCCYEDKSRQVMNAQRQLVQLSGKLICEGDINPDKAIEGFVRIGAERKTIYRAARPRNPDGSVFSTELELS